MTKAGQLEGFEKLCRNKFVFLQREYKYKLVNIKRSIYGTHITYKNSTTAVIVSDVRRDGGIFVKLVRLVDGAIPPYPITIKPDTVLHHFDLNDILSLRNPSARPAQPDIDALRDPEVLSEVITKYARALRLHAPDILQGNFTLFPQLDRIVRKRAAQFSNLR